MHEDNCTENSPVNNLIDKSVCGENISNIDNDTNDETNSNFLQENQNKQTTGTTTTVTTTNIEVTPGTEIISQKITTENDENENKFLSSIETTVSSIQTTSFSLNENDKDKNLLANKRFLRLFGETNLDENETTEGVIILTNYRLFHWYSENNFKPISIPLCNIERIDVRDLIYLNVNTKMSQSFVCVFESNEDLNRFYAKINDTLLNLKQLDNLFCFKFFKESLNNTPNENNENSSTTSENSILFNFINLNKKNEINLQNSTVLFTNEFKRLEFNNSDWRMTDVNKEFKLCSSYPKLLIVPANVTDTDLEEVVRFRYFKRFPAVVWRNKRNGCIIARSSQPEVGWFGSRNSLDEKYLQEILFSCFPNQSSETLNKKLLIVDARSYAAAVANRAKGGGCECPEYYPYSEIQFMCLANIHAIRKSFMTLRDICETSADQMNWLSLLEGSKWLYHISSLLKSALIIVNAIDKEERPVLVHCSDGWDRTPQLVALSELILDPFYRTIDGFRYLIEREWLDFGHKFADRCGNAPAIEDINERCPVFLQWLDCVFQLINQYPCSFEFNAQYLEKIAFHTYSCLFSTFTCNNMHERFVRGVNERAHSIWCYLDYAKNQFVNHLYIQNNQVLRPSYKVKHLVFWANVYVPNSPGAVDSPLYRSSSHTNDKNSKLTAGFAKDDDINEEQSRSIESFKNPNESDSLTNTERSRSCDDLTKIASLDITTQEGERNRHHSESDLLESISNHEQIICPINCKTSPNASLIANLSNEVNTEENDSSTITTIAGESEQSDIKLSSIFNLCGECTEHLNEHKNMFSEQVNGFPTNELIAKCDIEKNSFNEIQRSFSPQPCNKKKSSSSSCCSASSNDETNDVCNNTKQTRTPSSGCPATPNDDQYSDISIPKLHDKNSDMFDIDGQVIDQDEVQTRLRQVINYYKAEADALRKELKNMKLALQNQSSNINGIKDVNSDNTPEESDTEAKKLDNSWMNISMSCKNEAYLPTCDHSITNGRFSQFQNCRYCN